jgi:hypothetical protein
VSKVASIAVGGICSGRESGCPARNPRVAIADKIGRSAAPSSQRFSGCWLTFGPPVLGWSAATNGVGSVGGIAGPFRRGLRDARARSSPRRTLVLSSQTFESKRANAFEAGAVGGSRPSALSGPPCLQQALMDRDDQSDRLVARVDVPARHARDQDGGELVEVEDEIALPRIGRAAPCGPRWWARGGRMGGAGTDRDHSPRNFPTFWGTFAVRSRSRRGGHGSGLLDKC